MCRKRRGKDGNVGEHVMDGHPLSNPPAAPSALRPPPRLPPRTRSPTPNPPRPQPRPRSRPHHTHAHPPPGPGPRPPQPTRHHHHRRPRPPLTRPAPPASPSSPVAKRKTGGIVIETYLAAKIEEEFERMKESEKRCRQWGTAEIRRGCRGARVKFEIRENPRPPRSVRKFAQSIRKR